MRLIDADALKKDWGMANRCEDCPRDARDCQYGMVLTRMDVCGMLDDAPTVGGWISVQDRLPEKDGVYLAYYDKTCVSSVYYEKGRERSEWTDDYEGYCDLDVTHWMPLPEPPEEVSGDA